MNNVFPPARAATQLDASEPLSAVSPKDSLDTEIDRWWHDHFPGSPVAAVTAAWNHAFAAKEELKRRLASLKEEH